MWNYKARIYAPTLGRFLQTDPIGYGDGMNWYAYVGVDPVNFVDPLGLSGLAILPPAPRCQTRDCDEDDDDDNNGDSSDIVVVANPLTGGSVGGGSGGGGSAGMIFTLPGSQGPVMPPAAKQDDDPETINVIGRRRVIGQRNNSPRSTLPPNWERWRRAYENCASRGQIIGPFGGCAPRSRICSGTITARQTAISAGVSGALGGFLGGIGGALAGTPGGPPGIAAGVVAGVNSGIATGAAGSLIEQCFFS